MLWHFYAPCHHHRNYLHIGCCLVWLSGPLDKYPLKAKLWKCAISSSYMKVCFPLSCFPGFWGGILKKKEISTYHGLHHVGLVVPQRLDRVEHIHDVLLLDHLADTADGAEGATAAATSAATTQAKCDQMPHCSTAASIILGLSVSSMNVLCVAQT